MSHKTGGWVAGFLLTVIAGASAENEAFAGSLFPQVRRSRARRQSSSFKLGASVETWRVETEIDDATPVGSDTDVEFFSQHSVALITGDYTFQGLGRESEIGLHAGIGRESIATRLDLGPAAGGPNIIDTRYEDDLVWEIGAFFNHDVGQADLGASILLRGGESEADRPGTLEITYEYTMIRIAGEVGIQTQEGIRPFLLLRYTMYDAEWKFDIPGVFTNSFDLVFDQPFGVGVGLDLGTDRFSGRIQLNFSDVEEIGFLASVGITF